MKKYAHVGTKVLLSLILLMPVLGITGILGQPTPDLYNTQMAYDFIMALTTLGYYINYMMVATCILGLIALWTGREALAALLILPVTANVVGFHLFIDGGLLTMGALLGNIMGLINIYLLYKHQNKYQPLLRKSQ